jgi:hypothetical protein
VTSRLVSTPKTPPAGWRGVWRAWRSQDASAPAGAGLRLAERHDRRLLWALALLGLHAMGHAQSVSLDTSRQVEGVVVNFSPDVLELSDAESRDLAEKMATFGPVATSQWRISVEVPKGFSEGMRLGYYRVNAVRNALLKNGVRPASIDLQTQQSAPQTANNTRVLVRLAPAAAAGASNLVVQGGAEGAATELGRLETVTATQQKSAPTGDASVRVVHSAVIVSFRPEVLELSEAESRSVMERIATYGSVANSKWRITVMVPKGSSEALRLGSERANLVRNLLLKNGVPSGNIDLETPESSQQIADRTFVVIRLAS